ncbi:MAG: hypothetical protein AAFQ66_09815 [Pseudomonadota bacterium]
MRQLLRHVRFFTRSTRASVSVEAILMFPMLALAMMSTYIYFDAYRAQNTNLKAVYTVADAISRESSINPSYLDTMYDLLNFLTHSNHPTRLRVTLVQCAETAECLDADSTTMVYDVVWSRVRGNIDRLTDANINELRDRLPVFPKGDTLLIVDTGMAYEPIFRVGIGVISMEQMAVIRARYIPPYICWQRNDDSYICPFGEDEPAT